MGAAMKSLPRLWSCLSSTHTLTSAHTRPSRASLFTDLHCYHRTPTRGACLGMPPLSPHHPEGTCILHRMN